MSKVNRNMRLNLRTSKKKRGYALVEAALAISLITSVQVFRASMDAEEMQFSKATEFGKDLAQVLYAIDRRVLLDGRVISEIDPTTGVTTKGDWTGSWSDTDAFFDGMIGQELIGKDHQLCGDSVSGWEPKVPENSRLALVNCFEINRDVTPFGFEFEGRRGGAVSADHILGEWSFLVYQPTDDDFYNNFKYYAYIKNKAELFDSLKMTGQHEVSYVDRSHAQLAEFSSISECWGAGSNCAIQFKYRTGQIGESMESPYMEIDGSTSLAGSLRFRTDASSPEKCFVHTDTNGTKAVDCGLDFDLDTGELAARVNEASSSTYELIMESSGGAAVPTLCTDITGAKKAIPCGLSVVSDSGSSVVASAYLDRVYTGKLHADSIEALDKITIRKSLDNSDPLGYTNTMEVGLEGLIRDDKKGSVMKVGFDDHGITAEALGRTIALSSRNINLKALNDMAVEGRDIKIKSDNARLIDRKAVAPNLHSKYGNPRDSKLATQSFALDGVKIVGMDIVGSGTAVRRKACPSISGKATPRLKWTTYPAAGFNSNIKNVGSTCNTLSPSFFNVRAKTRVIRTSYSNRSQVTKVKTDISGKVSCDPARDTSVTYGVSSNSSNLTPTYTFWGGSKGKSYRGVKMMLIQYCDYTK